jgi:hypothetical protein
MCDIDYYGYQYITPALVENATTGVLHYSYPFNETGTSSELTSAIGQAIESMTMEQPYAHYDVGLTEVGLKILDEIKIDDAGTLREKKCFLKASFSASSNATITEEKVKEYIECISAENVEQSDAIAKVLAKVINNIINSGYVNKENDMVLC